MGVILDELRGMFPPENPDYFEIEILSDEMGFGGKFKPNDALIFGHWELRWTLVTLPGNVTDTDVPFEERDITELIYVNEEPMNLYDLKAFIPNVALRFLPKKTSLFVLLCRAYRYSPSNSDYKVKVKRTALDLVPALGLSTICSAKLAETKLIPDETVINYSDSLIYE